MKIIILIGAALAGLTAIAAGKPQQRPVRVPAKGSK